jgi:serine/threonine-protein kinase
MPLAKPNTIPERLGRFELYGEIGSGGMATVYLGRMSGPAGFEKLVAVKVIHPHLAKKRAFVDMFLDEARVAAACSHPNVCGVIEIGDEGGVPYIAMEHLSGDSVARVAQRTFHKRELRSSFQFARVAARIIADACRGLHAVHELKSRDGTPLEVIHRDVTPANLIVTYSGHVKVVDFGVARAANQIHETEAGSAKGKLAYMSPEQLSNEELDRRTDVWSMGVTLWELLTQKRLFTRSNQGATTRAILNDPIPPVAFRDGPAPDELVHIVNRALARDRDRRYPTALALAQALEQFIDKTGEPVRTEDIAAFMNELFEKERTQKEHILATLPRGFVEVDYDVPIDASGVVAPKRRRWPLVATALAAALLLVGAGALTVALGLHYSGVAERATPEPAPARVATRAPEPAPPQTTKIDPIEAPLDEAPPEPAPDLVDADRTPRERPPVAIDRSVHPVSVTTPGGWAEISVDGQARGRTPARLSLTRGRHRLVLRPFGASAPIHRIIRVPEDSRVVVRLTP